MLGFRVWGRVLKLGIGREIERVQTRIPGEPWCPSQANAWEDVHAHASAASRQWLFYWNPHSRCSWTLHRTYAPTAQNSHNQQQESAAAVADPAVTHNGAAATAEDQPRSHTTRTLDLYSPGRNRPSISRPRTPSSSWAMALQHPLPSQQPGTTCPTSPYTSTTTPSAELLRTFYGPKKQRK